MSEECTECCANYVLIRMQLFGGEGKLTEGGNCPKGAIIQSGQLSDGKLSGGSCLVGSSLSWLLSYWAIVWGAIVQKQLSRGQLLGGNCLRVVTRNWIAVHVLKTNHDTKW